MTGIEFKKKAVCGDYKLCNPQNTSASHLGKKGNILVIPVSAEHIKEQRIDISYFFH